MKANVLQLHLFNRLVATAFSMVSLANRMARKPPRWRRRIPCFRLPLKIWAEIAWLTDIETARRACLVSTQFRKFFLRRTFHRIRLHGEYKGNDGTWPQQDFQLLLSDLSLSRAVPVRRVVL